MSDNPASSDVPTLLSSVYHLLIRSTWMEVSLLPSYLELKEQLTFLSSASAFVGLATMIVLFPVPGYIAKKVRDVQVQRMKMVLSQLMFLMFLFLLTDILFKFKTDARVQDVTEGTLHAT